MFKKYTSILFIATWAALLLVCVGCSDDISNMNSNEIKYEISSIQLSAMDNMGLIPQEMDADTISKDALVIGMALDNAQNIDQQRTQRDAGFRRLVDPIVSITVETKTNFSDSIPANSDITHFFGLLNGDKRNLTEFSSDVYPYSSLELAMLQSPRSGKHEFEVFLHLRSGKVLSQSISVNLK